jgi:hypothetical protein
VTRTQRIFRCCCLIILLMVPGFTLFAQQTAAKVKSQIRALGAEQNTEVQVTLKSGSVLTGRIHQPGPKDFILITAERAQAYNYTEVVQVQKKASDQRGPAK